MSKTVSFHEADAQFNLRTILPAYNEDEDVTLLPPGTYKARALELDEQSYVVDGDLHLDGDVRCSEEGGFLVVLGNLVVNNLLIGGPIVYVQGSLTAGHAIHTDYNHGVLTVLGDVQAKIIAAEHVFRIEGALRCDTTIDFGGFQVSGAGFAPTLTRQQAARESREWLVPDVLNSQGYVDGAALAEFLAEGGDPLRRRPEA